MIHPLILAEYINYFNPDKPYTYNEAWLLGVSVIVISFVNCLLMHHMGLGGQICGMRCRVACCSLIYRKVRVLNKRKLNSKPLLFSNKNNSYSNLLFLVVKVK